MASKIMMINSAIIIFLVMRSTPLRSPRDTMPRPNTIATVIQKIKSGGFESISPKPLAIWSGVPFKNSLSVSIL